MRRLSLLIALALTTAGLLAGSAPSLAATRSCSDSDRFLQQLKATNVGCAKARPVMYAWARSSSCIRGGSGLLATRVRTCTVKGYRCVPHKAEGGVTVRATQGDRVLRWFDSQG
ncbi:MAG: hypothetical protein JWM71_1188 [Solirubrobacteraceae bacterium]|nr:hypothetical protein [Solirubrobacteraceae bacterium]